MLCVALSCCVCIVFVVCYDGACLCLVVFVFQFVNVCVLWCCVVCGCLLVVDVCCLVPLGLFGCGLWLVAG